MLLLLLLVLLQPGLLNSNVGVGVKETQRRRGLLQVVHTSVTGPTKNIMVSTSQYVILRLATALLSLGNSSVSSLAAPGDCTVRALRCRCWCCCYCCCLGCCVPTSELVSRQLRDYMVKSRGQTKPQLERLPSAQSRGMCAGLARDWRFCVDGPAEIDLTLRLCLTSDVSKEACADWPKRNVAEYGFVLKRSRLKKSPVQMINSHSIVKTTTSHKSSFNTTVVC